MSKSTLCWAITWTTYCEGGVKQVSNIKAYKAYASTEPDGTINIGIHGRGTYLEDCYYVIPPKDTESGPLGIRFKGAGASQKDGGDPRVVVLLRDRNLVPAALAAVREHLTVHGLTASGVIEIDVMLQTGVRGKLDWSKWPGPEIANASDDDPPLKPDAECATTYSVYTRETGKTITVDLRKHAHNQQTHAWKPKQKTKPTTR
jgi:hypothetical protein